MEILMLSKKARAKRQIPHVFPHMKNLDFKSKRHECKMGTIWEERERGLVEGREGQERVMGG
jgi:hypothetical protein